MDYRDMLNDKDIDAVMISTPDHWHSQPAMEAAMAGKDIYLQKPTSLTVDEGRQLVHAVQKNNVILQVGTQQKERCLNLELRLSWLEMEELGSCTQ